MQNKELRIQKFDYFVLLPSLFCNLTSSGRSKTRSATFHYNLDQRKGVGSLFRGSWTIRLPKFVNKLRKSG